MPCFAGALSWSVAWRGPDTACRPAVPCWKPLALACLPCSPAFWVRISPNTPPPRPPLAQPWVLPSCLMSRLNIPRVYPWESPFVCPIGSTSVGAFWVCLFLTLSLGPSLANSCPSLPGCMNVRMKGPPEGDRCTRRPLRAIPGCLTDL